MATAPSPPGENRGPDTNLISPLPPRLPTTLDQHEDERTPICRATWLATPLLCAASLAITAVEARAEVSVKDDIGNTVKLAQPAKRIVSLAPHMTETLFAAGAGDRIVGTVDYSDYPEAAKKIPRVGGYSRFDMETVAALKPDLIVGWQSGNAAARLDKFRSLGCTMYISQPNRIEDVASEIERLGTLAGTSATASTEAKRYRDQLAALRTQYTGKATVRTFYQIWKQPLMTVGRTRSSPTPSACAAAKTSSASWNRWRRR